MCLMFLQQQYIYIYICMYVCKLSNLNGACIFKCRKSPITNYAPTITTFTLSKLAQSVGLIVIST